MPAAPDDRCKKGSIESFAALPREPPGGCARDLWQRLCDEPRHEAAEYVCDDFTEAPEPDREAFALRVARRRPAPLGSPVQRSRNWSGAWLTPTSGRRFTAVWGSWIVPESQGIVPPPERGRAPAAARCSHWVGIGGHRRHSLSLPQVGTMAAINWRGEPEYYAWYQWWEPSRSYGPLKITNLDVLAGDPIIAAVTVEALDTVGLYIRNHRTGDLRSIRWRANDADNPAAVDGKSAEWVVERPSWFDRDDEPHFFRLPPLAHPAEPARFGCCGAVAAEAPGGPEVARDLTGARLVRMVGRRSDGPGSKFLAVPKKRGTSALDVAVRGE